MIYIVLPAYNEESSIKVLLESIDESMKEIQERYKAFVVNDGSTDKTAEIVEFLKTKMPVELINHSVNMGLGEALKSGFLEIIKVCEDKDIVFTMDADNTHPPVLIKEMIGKIREGNDVVIASRYQKGAKIKGVTFFRRILSRGVNILLIITRRIQGVRDYSCGYRAYRANVLKKAFTVYGDGFLSQSGFSCMVDILLKLRRLNLIFNEVPLTLRYDLKQGATKMKITKNIRDILLLILKDWLRPEVKSID